jgi:glycosyltransferase involved in cell wall biosynthesis
MVKESDRTNVAKTPIPKVIYLSYLDQRYSRSGVHLTYLKSNSSEISTEFVALRLPLKVNLFMLGRLVWKNRKNKCVYLVMSPANAILILLRILTRKKIILDAGWPSIDSTKIRSNSKSRLIKSYFLDLVCFHLASLVLLESEAQRNRCRRAFRIRSKKLKVVYTGFNEIAFTQECNGGDGVSVEVRNLINQSNDLTFVLFRGLDNAEAGLENLVKAARDLPSVFFCLASPNTRIQPTTRNLVVIKNWLNTNDLKALYERANCVLGQLGDLPRNTWTIAHKVFEAGYFGKALISSNSLALEEIFTEGRDMVFYSSSQGLSELITKLVEVDEIRNSLETEIKLTYNKKISQQRISQRFIEVVRPLF